MNALDGAVVVVLLLAGLGGWRFGFVARMLAWCGIAVALVVAFHFVPRVVTSFGGTSADDRVTVAVLFLVLAATLGQTAGFGLGVLAHRPSRTARTLPTWDRVTGAAVGVLGVVVVTWILAPALSSARGWSAREARGSAILGLLDDVSPEQPPRFAAWGRTISDAPYPSVLSPVGELPDKQPPRESGITPAVSAIVERSTLLVQSDACGWIVRGTGWVAANGIVVTNAHVVAGEHDTSVEDTSGRTYDATVVAFDAKHDLALLRVADLELAPLRRAPAPPGATGAVYGHPDGGDLAIVPALVGKTTSGQFGDVYGRDDVDRRAVTFVGAIVEGYSGGPLVNQEGRVMGVVFSHRTDYSTVSYAIPADAVTALIRATEVAHPKAVGNRVCAVR